MQPTWSGATIVLYIATILVATVISFLSYKKGELISSADGTQMPQGATINKFGMVVVFLCLWQLLAFSACGADYESYNHLFLNALDLKYIIGHHNLEVGFAGLNLLIRLFTDNVNIYNGLLAALFLFLIFRTLYKLKDHVHFGWGILVFSCMFYLQFMNLKRIYLAAAICFYAIPYLLKKQNLKVIIIVVLAATVHVSAIFMLIPCLLIWLFSKTLKWWHLLALMTMGVVLSYVFRNQIMALVTFSRYEDYDIIETGFGLAQIVYHVPLIWMLVRKKAYQNSVIVRYSFIFLLCCFAISMLGYFIEAIGRMSVYFIFPFVLAPSLYQTTHNGVKKRSWWLLREENIVSIVAFGYFAFRLFMYCSTMLNIDGLMPYISIFS